MSRFRLYGLSDDAFGLADTFKEEFRYIFDYDVFASGLTRCASEHALTEGASDREDFFSGSVGQGLLDLAETVVGDALVAGFFFFPELCASGPAAEGVFAVAREFSGGVVAEDVEKVAGSVVDAVVAA